MDVLVNSMQSLYYACGSTDWSRILMLGLDSAGKTTILYKTILNETITTTPTVGINVETLAPRRGVTLMVWDFGGEHKIRPFWRSYFQNMQGLIFVINSADRERFETARQELFSIFDFCEHFPVVVIANKQDLPGAASTAEMTDKLALTTLRSKWSIHASNALTGDGIHDAMDSLATLLKAHKRTSHQ